MRVSWIEDPCQAGHLCSIRPAPVRPAGAVPSRRDIDDPTPSRRADDRDFDRLRSESATGHHPVPALAPVLVDLPGAEGGRHRPTRLAAHLAGERGDLAMEKSARG